MLDDPPPANRAQRRACLPAPARRVRDDLIRQWLTGTPRGRAICTQAGLPLPVGIMLTRRMLDTGHLVMTVGETRPDGTFSFAIRETLPALTGRAEA
jgi:hypothetical protein